MLAAISVAACRTVEAPFVVMRGSLFLPALLWGGVGAAMAALSLRIAPPALKSEAGS
jgi:hypothetical protein